MIFGLEEKEVIERNKVRALLCKDYINKDSLLRQKARVKWVKEGDGNSAMFHRLINGRRKTNKIAGLMVDGVWCEDPGVVKNKIKEIFQKQYSARSTAKVKIPTSFCSDSISVADNERLIEKFTEKEVHDALADCDESKCPGPDGFSMGFF